MTTVGLSYIECTQCKQKKETRFFRILGAREGFFDFSEACRVCEEPLDHDIYQMTRYEVIAEVIKLRNGIRTHRDSSGHNLCWYHPEMWALLPDKVEPKPEVPEKEEFMRCCKEYRESLDKKV